MVWWVRFKLTIRGRRARAGENSSPENVCEILSTDLLLCSLGDSVVGKVSILSSAWVLCLLWAHWRQQPGWEMALEMLTVPGQQGLLRAALRQPGWEIKDIWAPDTHGS